MSYTLNIDKNQMLDRTYLDKTNGKWRGLKVCRNSHFSQNYLTENVGEISLSNSKFDEETEFNVFSL